MKFGSIIVLVTCLTYSVYSGSPCPSETEIVPCKCSKFGADTAISCNFYDPAILKLAFNRMSELDMIVDSINMSSTRLNLVNTSFFQDMTIRRAIFSGDRWSSIDQYAFEGQETSLESLMIVQSLLTKIPVAALNILTALKKFTMIRSEVTRIEDKAFSAMESAEVLVDLDLSNNYIKTVGNDAFEELLALRYLNLDGNKIKSLPTNFIAADNKITSFLIRDNELESLSIGIESFQEGSKLDFSNNRVTYVSGKVLQSVISNRLSVNLTGNPLRCGCSMKLLATTEEDYNINGVCEQPLNVHGMKLQELSSTDFVACFLSTFLAKL